MDLVHVTTYIDKETFEKMERVRKAIVRQTRSQWVHEAIAEKAEREARERFPEPAQRPSKKRDS